MLAVLPRLVPLSRLQFVLAQLGVTRFGPQMWLPLLALCEYTRLLLVQV